MHPRRLLLGAVNLDDVHSCSTFIDSQSMDSHHVQCMEGDRCTNTK